MNRNTRSTIVIQGSARVSQLDLRARVVDFCGGGNNQCTTDPGRCRFNPRLIRNETRLLFETLLFSYVVQITGKQLRQAKWPLLLFIDHLPLIGIIRIRFQFYLYSMFFHVESLSINCNRSTNLLKPLMLLKPLATAPRTTYHYGQFSFAYFGFLNF